MSRQLEQQLDEIEILNTNLEERVQQVEEANGRIAHLAQELEYRNSTLQETIARLSTLNRAGMAINSTMDRQQMFNLLVRMTMETTGAQIGHLLLHDQQNNSLQVKILLGDVPPLAEGSSLPMRESSVSCWVIRTGRPLLLSSMDEARGFDRETDLGYTRESVACVPLRSRGEVIGALSVANRRDGSPFSQNDLELLSTIAAQAGIALENAQLYENQQKTYLSTIQALVSAVEACDSYTRGHSERVTRYSVGLAEKLGLSAEQRMMVERAAILHDIGKIGIDQQLLQKRGRLAAQEIFELRQHPRIGMTILEPIEFLTDVRTCIGQHHERYDGMGYPGRLPGVELRLESRILAITDAFDAMTSDRPYRSALSQDKALGELRTHAGSQFDPNLVPHFIELVESNFFTSLKDSPPGIPFPPRTSRRTRQTQRSLTPPANQLPLI